MLTLLTSCGSSASKAVSRASSNRSALYDPPVVTLAPGTVYHFKEGDLTGSGQKFYSTYTFQKFLIENLP